MTTQDPPRDKSEPEPRRKKGLVGKLFGRTAAFTSGNLVYLGGQFVFLWLVARLGDPTLVGLYGLSTALLNPLFFFTRLGMRRAQASDAHSTFSFATYRRLRNVILAICVAIGVSFLFVLPSDFATAFVFLLILVAKLFEAQSDLYYGLALQEQRQHVIGVSLVARAASSVLLYLFFYFVLRDPMYAMIGMPIGWLAIYFLYDKRQARPRIDEAVGPGPAWPIVWALFVNLWPLGVAAMLGQLQQSVPRILVAGGESVDVLGAIVPALQIHMMVGVLAQSVAQSLLPGLAGEMQGGGRAAAKRRLLIGIFVALPVLLASIPICFFYGTPLIHLVFGGGYELSGAFLGLAAISWSLRYVAALLQNTAVSARKFGTVLRDQLLATLGYVAISIGGYVMFGLAGVFYALIAGNALQLLISLWTSRRLIRMI
ncbi:lipopolysaccharide biosynthesis protein [bacterium]|nr:lipopolysaccharide biosynthesis protein [bacterium]